MNDGQTYFMQNQTNTTIAITWPIKVVLKSTRVLLCSRRIESPGRRTQLLPTRSSAAVSADARIAN